MEKEKIFCHAAIILTVAIWGGLSISIKYLLREISPMSVSVARVYPASILAIVFILIFSRHLKRINRQDWYRLIVASGFGFFAVNYIIPIGHKFITAGVGTLTIATTPIWAAIFARVLLKEKLSKHKMVGIGIAFAGLMVVMFLGGPTASFHIENVKGVLITILGPMFFALYSVFGKPLTSSYRPSILTSYGLIIGMILFIPFLSKGVVTDFFALSCSGWLAVAFLSIIATFFVFQLWYFSLSRVEATKAIVYTNLTPFFGLVGASLILGESIGFWLILGGCIIVIGIILTNRA